MQASANKDDVIEIDLQELLGLLIHWLWLIVGCGIATGMIGFLLSYFIITPKYESTTKVYILDTDSKGGGLTYSDVQLGTLLTKDYVQLIKDRTVLEKVLGNLESSESYGSLVKRVKVEAQADTRIIAIVVTDHDPLMAQTLANEIRKVAADHIKSVTEIQAVNVVEEANLPFEPSAPNILKWTAVGGLIGMFLCAMILIVRFLLDDTIKTGDDVERYLELSTLAMIPVIEDESAKNRKKEKGRTQARGKYGNRYDTVGEIETPSEKNAAYTYSEDTPGQKPLDAEGDLEEVL